jgi:hypothetical protein
LRDPQGVNGKRGDINDIEERSNSRLLGDERLVPVENDRLEADQISQNLRNASVELNTVILHVSCTNLVRIVLRDSRDRFCVDCGGIDGQNEVPSSQVNGQYIPQGSSAVGEGSEGAVE